MKTNLLDRRVSFGTNIYRPDRLETRRLGDILGEIQNGEWRREVQMIRRLRGDDQSKAKNALPFFTPSGCFRKKENAALVQYSGIAVVDLDDLSPASSKRVLHRAIDDPHCFAAFRSPTGTGMKLLIRVPRTFGKIHGEIFGQVASHVRNEYGVAPDVQRDVSRACFVSWDSEMYFRPTAKSLPIVEPTAPDAGAEAPAGQTRSQSEPKVPVKFYSLIGERQPGDWPYEELGREAAPKFWKPGEKAHYTYKPLLQLARRFWTNITKLGVPAKAVVRLMAVTFKSWWERARWKGVEKRATVYWIEFKKMVRDLSRSNHSKANAEKWTRWRKHRDFPRNGTSREQILFAIRKHCEESRTVHFFLSQRDAGSVAKIAHTAARKHVEKLRLNGLIAFDPDRKRRPGQRSAQDWVLRVKG